MQRKHLITLVLLTLPFFTYAQKYKWAGYNENSNKHNAIRVGVGINALEPTGFIIDLYNGFFCDRTDTQVTYFHVEFSGGYEKAFIDWEHTSGQGRWESGGRQFGANAFAGLFHIKSSAGVFQMQAGAGFQFGNRNFMFNDELINTQTVGSNLIFRNSFSTTGIKFNKSYLFLDFHVDLKYHRQADYKFCYLLPNTGVTVRRIF